MDKEMGRELGSSWGTPKSPSEREYFQFLDGGGEISHLVYPTRWGGVVHGPNGVERIFVARSPEAASRAYAAAREKSGPRIKSGSTELSVKGTAASLAGLVGTLPITSAIWTFGSEPVGLTAAAIFGFASYWVGENFERLRNSWGERWIEVSEGSDEVYSLLDSLSLALEETPNLGLEPWNSAVLLLESAVDSGWSAAEVAEDISELTRSAVEASIAAQKILNYSRVKEGNIPAVPPKGAKSLAKIEDAKKRARSAVRDLEAEKKLLTDVVQELEERD